MWFTYIILILTYTIMNAVWMMAVVNEDYKDDKPFRLCFIVILSTSCYIAIASLALEMIIMLIIMILMVFTLIPFIFGAIFGPLCLNWRPNNGDIDRDEFIDLLNQDNTTDDVLVYLFRNNKRHFKKSSEVKDSTNKNCDKERAQFVYPKEKARLNTDRSESEDIDMLRHQDNNATLLPTSRDDGTICEQTGAIQAKGILSK